MPKLTRDKAPSKQKKKKIGKTVLPSSSAPMDWRSSTGQQLKREMLRLYDSNFEAMAGEAGARRMLTPFVSANLPENPGLTVQKCRAMFRKLCRQLPPTGNAAIPWDVNIAKKIAEKQQQFAANSDITSSGSGSSPFSTAPNTPGDLWLPSPYTPPEDDPYGLELLTSGDKTSRPYVHKKKRKNPMEAVNRYLEMKANAAMQNQVEQQYPCGREGNNHDGVMTPDGKFIVCKRCFRKDPL